MAEIRPDIAKGPTPGTYTIIAMRGETLLSRNPVDPAVVGPKPILLLNGNSERGEWNDITVESPDWDIYYLKAWDGSSLAIREGGVVTLPAGEEQTVWHITRYEDGFAISSGDEAIVQGDALPNGNFVAAVGPKEHAVSFAFTNKRE